MTAPATDHGGRGALAPAGRGLVALGDSITLGEGAPALGITALSWAQWLARALDAPYTCYAANGATAAHVVAEQLPRVHGPYDLACLYIGVNDVRDPAFDPVAYERALRAAAGGLAGQAARLLLLAPPHDLGRPTCAPKPLAARAILRRVAARHDAVLCDLADFGGWLDVQPDAVHPTAVGQVEIADRAARALGAVLLPSALAGVGRTPVHHMRHAPVHARALARDLWRRGREGSLRSGLRRR